MSSLTRHHLTPKCHRKKGYKPRIPTDEELIYLTREKHDAWHLLFKEATLDQIIVLLLRIKRRLR